MDGAGSPLRRAATRETTGPLKAWLSEHKKNPYPTKAEKIMLAIITRMTLTQVSTWFANARRRLKKDNRLSSGDGDAEDDTSTLDIDSDKEGDSDTASLVIPSTPTTRHIEDRPVESRTHDREELDLPSKHDSSTPMIRRVDGGKLSSEGEVDQDSFSDISDDENENMFRSMRNRASAHRGQPISCAGTRVAVITSPALPSTISHETEVVRARPEHQQTTTSSPEPGLAGVDLSITSTNSHGVEKKPEAAQTKPKPKIWSISHILDS